MASLRKLVYASAVLIAVGLPAAASTNATQDSLIAASDAGDLSRVKALLAADADVNAKEGHGATALYLASQNGHLAVVQALLAAKAEVNAKDNNGHTPLGWATREGHDDAAELLRRHGGHE